MSAFSNTACRVAACLIVAMAAIAGPAAAQNLADGERIAKTWCAGCHRVGQEQAARRNDAVPSFASIAQMSSTTQMSLEAFLVTPHARMPDYSLSRNEIQNVSAYILSLRHEQ